MCVPKLTLRFGAAILIGIHQQGQGVELDFDTAQAVWLEKFRMYTHQSRRATIVALFLALINSTSLGAQENRPNIVFILADDWGWGDLGCYGHARLKTPRLDRLASQGTIFTQFYVCSGVCSPSRTAFLTGQFPARHRIHGHLATEEQNRQRGMPNFLDPSAPLLTRQLKDVGYVTGHYGKWHLGNGEGAPTPDAYAIDEHRSTTSNGPTWDLWGLELRPKSSELIMDETIGFIERHKDQPFYVQAWLHDTHATLNPTDEQLQPYEAASARGIRFKSAAQIYSAAATNADRHIGRLLDRLDALGLAENTLVVFSADNGPEEIAILNAAHSGVGSPGPFRGRKRSLYEGGIRVPFIVRWPGTVPAGVVNAESVVSAVDFLPTVCKLTGAPLPAGAALDGEDRSAVLRGGRLARTKPLMWDWRFRIIGHPINISPRLAIRDGNWKLLLNPDRSRVELYDIVGNPMEVDNLADRHPEIVSRLTEQVLAWQATLPPGPVEPAAGSNAYPWPASSSAK